MRGPAIMVSQLAEKIIAIKTTRLKPNPNVKVLAKNKAKMKVKLRGERREKIRDLLSDFAGYFYHCIYVTRICIRNRDFYLILFSHIFWGLANLVRARRYYCF